MDYYSEIASGYDELYGEEQDAKLQDFLSKVTINDNSTLLDIGCGTGRSLQLLPFVNWHGVEPAQGLIDHATEEAKLRITKGVAESLRFPDASFDVVLSLTAMHHFSDPCSALSEMKRVSKPGGLLLLSYLTGEWFHPLDTLIKATFTVQESWKHRNDTMYICLNTSPEDI